jgi:hypothetical protein
MIMWLTRLNDIGKLYFSYFPINSLSNSSSMYSFNIHFDYFDGILLSRSIHIIISGDYIDNMKIVHFKEDENNIYSTNLILDYSDAFNLLS